MLGLALLTVLFIALLFPWTSVARRVAHDLARASGGQVEMATLAPAWTARGPVLAARDVRIAHPAVERLRIHALEIAPRPSTSWLSGEPKLRVWADSELARVDGILRLGSDASRFDGRVEQVAIDKLPLRLDASGLVLVGLLDADARVAIEPGGTLQGTVRFESDDLIVQSPLLPLAIPFSRTTGEVELLETGATRIAAARFEGPLIQGDLSGDIGLVHRSLSPPIDLEARIEILDDTLRAMAPAAGLPLSPEGRAALRLGGTIDAPEFGSLDGRGRRAGAGR